MSVSVSPPTRIELDDLTLVRPRPSDAERVAAAVTRSLEHLRPWMPWAAGYADPSHAPTAAAEFLAHAERAWDDGAEYGYLLEDADATVIGAVSFMDRIGPGGREIGYWLAHDRTGRGLATRAAAALTCAALRLDEVDHVEIHHDRANARSGAIPRRLGYRHVGSRPSPEQARASGDLGILELWRMTVADFPASPASALLAER